MGSSDSPTRPAGNEVEQLARAAELHSQGAITDSEFSAIKARVLGTDQPAPPPPPPPASASAAPKKPDRKKVVQGCLTLLGLLVVCGGIGSFLDSRELARLPESARTATIAARNATRTPRPVSTVPSADSATDSEEEPAADPDIGSEDNPAGLSTPAILNTSAWAVVYVKDHGDTLPSGNQFITSPTTSGKFIEVQVVVVNGGTDALSVFEPKMIDSAGREYDSSSDAIMIIDSQQQCLLETLNPGLDKHCTWVYDVPASATGLKLKVTEGLFGKSGFLRVDP